MRNFFLALLLVCKFSVACAELIENEEKEYISPPLPEELGTLESNQDFFVHDYINPLTGLPVFQQTDLVAKGAENVVLGRTYVSSCIPDALAKKEKHEEYALYKYLENRNKGWVFFPHTRLVVENWRSKQPEVRLVSSSGSVLDFCVSGQNFSLKGEPYGIHNLGPDGPSGKYDLRNIKISAQDNWKSIIVNFPDGTTRFYGLKSLQKVQSLYLLEKEIRPNGKVLKFQYSKKVNNPVKKIESLDPSETKIYASIEGIHHPLPSSFLKESHQKTFSAFMTNTGQKAHYYYSERKASARFRKRSHKATTGLFIDEVRSPYNREGTSLNTKLLLNKYEGCDDQFTCTYEICKASKASQGYYKIKTLYAPVGANGSNKPLYDFYYNSPVPGESSGYTKVEKKDGLTVKYNYSANLLIDSIEYTKDNLIKKTKHYTWDKDHRCRSMESRDHHGNLFYKKDYEYDCFGNPVVEIVTGDLTGNGENDTYVIKREFSQDGRNLLVSEEREEGLIQTFQYHPQTNLITCKLTKDTEKILSREFFEYDDCLNLIKKIKDDGNGTELHDLSAVKQRLVTKYVLRNQYPFLHKPEWIEEAYLEDGQEKSLKKIHLFYDTLGNVSQEEIFDSAGQLAYTIYKEYNERGDVLSETNALGQKALYKYDEKGNCISKTNFSQNICTEMLYDKASRLIEEKEMGADGIIHQTSYAYDDWDRCIQKIDTFGNVTNYIIDPITEKPIKTSSHSIKTKDGVTATELVTRSSEWDSFGREVSRTDANGNQKIFAYNVYGSLTKVECLRGTQKIIETFEYTKGGKLKKYTDQDGNYSEYVYNAQGKLLSKTYYSAKDELLAKETYEYDSFHLIKKTDREGNSTSYTYDGAGRKVQEEFCDRITKFAYNTLGQLCEEVKCNAENTLVTLLQKDLMNRILEETQTDLNGNVLYKISYAYDADGNHSSTIRYINKEESKETWTYDSFERLIEKCDALGNVTTISYNESYINEFGQKVLQKVIRKPGGTTSAETYDIYNRIVKKEILDPPSSQEMAYDSNGNLVEQKDYVYADNCILNKQVTRYEYDSLNQVSSYTRAYGTQDELKTSLSYTPSGKLARENYAGKELIEYTYTPLGYLQSIYSHSKIHHEFEYNRLGVLLKAQDLLQKIDISREVDAFGNVVKETFSTGIEIEKTYDNFDRLLSLSISNHGKIVYSYDPCYLRSVNRYSSNENLLYSHHYLDYGLNGNIEKETLSDDLGEICTKYDQNGFKTAITSPYFTEQCEYDERGNLTKRLTNDTSHLYVYNGLNQLTQEEGPHETSKYTYDSINNLLRKNSEKFAYNALNELISTKRIPYEYDSKRNLIIKDDFKLSYDLLNQLVKAENKTKQLLFTYDPLGRRLSKTVLVFAEGRWKEEMVENYLYDGNQEIGAISNGQLKQLRLLGLYNSPKEASTVAIEIDGKNYAVICDQQRNVRLLIDPISKKPCNQYRYTAYGEVLNSEENVGFNPWQYAAKRFDSEFNLIYFGKRYYNPALVRWMSRDPAGIIDSHNPYQYLLNNPFKYSDPDGEFAFVVAAPVFTYAFGTFGGAIVLPSLTTLTTIAATATVTWVAYKGIEALNRHDTFIYLAEISQGEGEAKPGKKGRQRGKDNAIKGGPPRHPVTGDYLADPAADGSHTTYGIKIGSDKKPYLQGATFDKNKKFRGRTDVTDHSRGDHLNPHWHEATGTNAARPGEGEAIDEAYEKLKNFL